MSPYNPSPQYRYGKRIKTKEEKRRENAALLVGIIVVVGFFFTMLQFGDPIDDAYVSFVYAKNLLSGNGLTFNPGERVEGYSNFLWVLLSCIAGKDSIPGTAQAIGFMIGLTNIVLVYFVARKSGAGSMSHLATALFATDLSVSVWNVEGLETPFYTFTILLTLLLFLRKKPTSLWAFTALLAAMTRPEGVIVFAAFAGYRLYETLRKRSSIDKIDVMAAAIFVIGFGIYNAWRYSYFGELLPNTFYARGGFNGPKWGALYLAQSLWNGRQFGVILMLVVVGFGLKFDLSRVADREGTPLLLGPGLAWLIVGTLVVLATGGDWMPNGRFIVPLLPVFYILVAHGVRFFNRPIHYYSLLVLLIGTNIFGQMAYGRGDSFAKKWAREQSSFYMPVAEWLNKQDAAGKKVVLSDVGYITYYTNIRAIDTLGLTNKRLARVEGGSAWATDIDYVMGENPDYIIRMERDYGDGKGIGHTEFDRKVVDDVRFIENYRYAVPINGYEATERAMGDLKVRDYKVTFKIYARRGD